MEQQGQDAGARVGRAVEQVRAATASTPAEGRIYLVGGVLRDRVLGLPFSGDIDIVIEGDAVELAKFLYNRGLSRHYPVLYPRFGTAMLTVETSEGECAVELVSARSERYHPDSRKPDVTPGTIREDVFRRDFTINTLIENVHTREVLDLTGKALSDLAEGLLRTPVEPGITFIDDPLRMLRAVRFAARFTFQIDPAAWNAIVAGAGRLRPPPIASERIREEFVKIAQLPGPRFRRGMELLHDSSLLAQFLPEMLPMVGCEQGAWHPHDVWTHTLVALESLPDGAGVETRLALLWHDIAKPATRAATDDEKGVRFTGHAAVGAETTRRIMNRLKFANAEIHDVTRLVELHMRLGEYRPEWTDPSVKRLIRDCGEHLESLFTITRCDQAAIDLPLEYRGLLDDLRDRIDRLNALSSVLQINSPLDGREIMEALESGPGPWIGEAKAYLTEQVIDGTLAEGDREGALRLLAQWRHERTLKSCPE